MRAAGACLFINAALAIALLGCSEKTEQIAPCAPPGPLEIRAFTEDTVVGTDLTCEPPTNWSRTCNRRSLDIARTLASVSGDHLQLVLNNDCCGGPVVTVDLTIADGGIASAGAGELSTSDIDTGDRTCDYTPATGGWIMPAEVSLNGRNRGQLEIILPDYTVRGSYDTAPPTCSASSACGPDEWCDFNIVEPTTEDHACPGAVYCGLGICRSRPVDCSQDCSQVCGSDGIVYCSACHAHAAGATARPLQGTCSKPLCCKHE